MIRKIIRIDDEKCNGCGQCIPNCPEGALQLIDGKARLVSDLFCDGLGACLGTCPLGAITVEEREAEPYDERRVMGNVVRQGTNVIRAHLAHLYEHGENEYLNQAIAYLRDEGILVPSYRSNDRSAPNSNPETQVSVGGCPGAAARDMRGRESKAGDSETSRTQKSRLQNWPVQLTLLNPNAPYLKGADLLVCADCVPFAYANFHQRFLAEKVMLTFCPKLDQNLEQYVDKLAHIFEHQDIQSLSVVHMEVPCCSGTLYLVEKALSRAKKVIPLREYTISISGELI